MVLNSNATQTEFKQMSHLFLTSIRNLALYDILASYMKQRVVSGGFIWYKGKFLLMKRADDDTFFPGFWEIPGGKLEYGENPMRGAEREIEEEAGINVDVGEPLSVMGYEHLIRGIQYIQINYLCLPVGEPKVKLSHEHSDFAWITFEDLKNYNISPKMIEMISNLASHKLVKDLK